MSLKNRIYGGLCAVLLLAQVAQGSARDETDPRLRASEFLQELARSINHIIIVRQRAFYRGTPPVFEALRAVAREKGCVSDLSIFADSERLQEDVLLAKFCGISDPVDSGEFFVSGKDLPSEVIGLWTSGYFGKRMEQVSRERGMNRRLDLGLIYELNIRAERLWRQMVECAGSSERARENYFRGEHSCGEMAELKLLHADVVEFVRTSHIEYDLAQWDEANRSGTIEMHPLLLQVFEELLATWLPTASTVSELRDWARESSASDAGLRMSENIVKLLPLLPQFDGTPIALWPQATRVAHAYYLAKFRYISHGIAAIISPGEALVNPGGGGSGWQVLNYLNPVVWIVRLFQAGQVWGQGQASIEPRDGEVANTFQMSSRQYFVARSEAPSSSPTAATAGRVAQAFRELGNQYGITQERLRNP